LEHFDNLEIDTLQRTEGVECEQGCLHWLLLADGYEERAPHSSSDWHRYCAVTESEKGKSFKADISAGVKKYAELNYYFDFEHHRRNR
jgi:hypothetical protein